MKFRQAKKIIKRESNKGLKSKWYGWLQGSPQWNKALKVYMSHAKVQSYIRKRYIKIHSNKK